MANITRFSAFPRSASFHDMERFLENMFRQPASFTGSGTPSYADIRTDISEDEKCYRVKADLPGVSKGDIKVSIEGNQVSIAAESKQETEQKGNNMLCCERYYGQQYRSFTLDTPVDDEKAEAKFENGVLELTLPKKAGAATRKIEIH